MVVPSAHNDSAVEREGTVSGPPGKRFKVIISDMVAYLGRAFNHGYINTVAYYPGRLDAERLRQATQLSVRAEPILGCRFVEGWYRPHWQRREDLEQTDLFVLVETDDAEMELERCLTKYLDPRKDTQVQVSLIRSDRDIVCIKLNHMVGDAFALYEYFYLLAEIYNSLEDNPDYLPLTNDSDRAVVQQISKRFDSGRKIRILRHVLGSIRKYRQHVGSWDFPVPQVKDPQLTFVTRQYPDRLRAISRYGRQKRVTVFHVLAAAYYLALRSTVLQHTYRPLPLMIPISLRRYLPADLPVKMCNVLGGTTVNIDADDDAPLDDVAVQVRNQMREQKEYLGLRSISLILTFPGLNLAFKAIPFGLIKKLFHQKASRFVRERKIKTCVLTTGGHFDVERLRFGNHEPEYVYALAAFSMAALLPMGASMFHQTLTMAVGFSERLVEKHTVEAVLDKVDQLLPR